MPSVKRTHPSWSKSSASSSPSKKTRGVGSSFSDPDADLLIRTSDDQTYAVQSLYLAAASSVFKDMFSACQAGASVESDGPRDGQASPLALPVVRVPEHSSVFKHFLTCVHSDKVGPFMKGHGIKSLVHTGVLAVAHKYEAFGVLAHAFATVVSTVEHDPENALAVGVVYGNEPLVCSAIKYWLASAKPTRWETGVARAGHIRTAVGSSTFNPVSKIEHPNRVPCSVSVIEPDLVERLPAGFFFYIAAAERHMLHNETFNPREVEGAFIKAFRAGFIVKSEQPVLSYGDYLGRV